MKLKKEELKHILVDIQSEEEYLKLTEMNYKKYLESKYWKNVRKTMHDKIGYECEVCGGKMEIYIHHFNYECIGRETLNDLACLCDNCHTIMHHYKNLLFVEKISNREEFEKQIKNANKIKKSFTSKDFLKIAPLTQRPSWEIDHLKSLYECETEVIRKMFSKELKNGLIIKSTGSCGNKNFEFYTLNEFIWYMIKLDFLKV